MAETADRWRRVEAICQSALDLPGLERAAYVRASCGGDAELQHEVERLLAHETAADGFLGGSIAAVAAGVMSPAPGSLTGQRLNGLEIAELIGAGGMGEVYRARDTKLKRDVAVKVLPPAFAVDTERLARFRREAQILASLNDPHIGAIYGFEDTGEIHGLVLELVEGPTLSDCVAQGAIPLEEALSIGRQIAQGLEAAHKQNIVHRDLKPANVKVRPDGVVKVLDFGLARVSDWARVEVRDAQATSITDPGVILGTPAYMSPEQVRGHAIDARTDIWALGAVLYEMLSRRPAFSGATTSDTIAAVLTAEPVWRDLPLSAGSPIRRLLRHCLQKDPQNRLDSVALAGQQIDAALGRVRSRARVASRNSGVSVPDRVAKPNNTSSGAMNAHSPRVDVASAISTTAPPVTARDAILLADFANTTGEPIFDGTLKQALAMKLEESPYLNIVSDDHVQRTLRLMGRPPDERLTVSVSREICERQSTKAMVTGSIASLGTRYVVTLAAINCQNGDSIARVQVEATSKERVLRALGGATARLRQALGESLTSIQQFDMPLAEVTTSSLDALKAFSLARLLRTSGNGREAIPLLKHAIDLDPDFAQAHNNLAAVYDSLREPALRNQYVTQAYERRSRVTERERLLITGYYHQAVSGDLLTFFETVTLLQRTYPRVASAYNMLGGYYSLLGQCDRAADAFREAARLAPDSPFDLINLAISYLGLNRLDDAKIVLDQALALKTESAQIHRMLGWLAYLQHDDVAKNAELAWLINHDPSGAFGLQASWASLAGKLRDARGWVLKRADLDTREGLVESAARMWLDLAETEGACGIAEAARQDVATALNLASSRDIARRAARILATHGFQEEAQSLLDRCVKEYPPTDTLAKELYIPAIHAASDLTRGHAAAAIQALQSALPYDAGDYAVLHLRASACLAAGRPSAAAAEFQKVIDRAQGGSVFATVAQLGRARALARMGDVGGSRALYRDFLAVWQDADPDLPILIAGRREYASLM